MRPVADRSAPPSGQSPRQTVPAAMTVMVVPFLQILLLGWVLGFAWRGRRAPGFVLAMKVLQRLRPWSMVEVCLLGALVAIVKLSGFMAVVPGIGIWALAALTFLMTLISSRDLHVFWHVPMEDDS